MMFVGINLPVMAIGCVVRDSGGQFVCNCPSYQMAAEIMLAINAHMTPPHASDVLMVPIKVSRP